MSTILFDLLLRLLPKRRRAQYGDEMCDVFVALADDARRAGRRATAVLLMKEVGGLMRFALRERLGRLSDWQPMGGWHPLRELKWAWRGVRARGWRAAFVVALFGVVLAANMVVFSVTDALVLNTLPYRDPERLVTLGMATHPRLVELRAQSDLLEAVHGYLPATTYLTGERAPVAIETAFVTPGLLSMLGGGPQYGRDFAEPDMAATEPPVAIVTAELARERFGRLETAVGSRIDTQDRALLVIGVMPDGFRFPDGRTSLWRVLDHARYSGRGVIISGFTGFWPIARLLPGARPADVERELIERIPEMKPRANAPAMNPVGFGRPSDDRRRLLFALLGAALCLLLTACANVTNLELATAIRRTRVHAIQSALGASRVSLLRTTLLEGALLVAMASALAAGLAVVSLAVVTPRLPARLLESGVNPIDLDWRSGAFMVVIAIATWLIASVPVLFSSMKQQLVPALQAESRAAASSGTGVIIRRLLTAGQVALAVVLLVGGLLFARTYAALLAVDRGVDTANVAAISLTVPPGAASAQLEQIAAEVVARLQAHPDVIAATRLSGPAPPGTGFAMQARPEIDGRPAGDDSLVALIYNVEQAFFETLRLPVLVGRLFDRTDPPTSAVISESMARRFWPGLTPVGHTFRISPSYPEYTVVGVVPHVRNNRDDLAGPSNATLTFYLPPPINPPSTSRLQRGGQPGPPPVNVPGAARATVITFLIRLGDESRLPAVEYAGRDGDARFQARAELLDDQYARRHAETLLATSIVTTFGALALIVTIAGVYGVMAFLVACRAREIGVRMALGASRRAVHRLVFGSSLRWVAAGAALGLCGAALASRWIQSQLFGVDATDPFTYLGVTLLISTTAALATWLPAKRAASVDPAATLRAE